MFSYERAFCRNLGWVTPAEQSQLREKKIAIAGLGGVGGFHLETLARLGVGSFHIADMDRFELENTNRQLGATTATLGQPKIEVMQKRVLDINPSLHVAGFPNGITKDNIDAFLDGVDLYIDSLDYFVFDIRQAVFRACRARGIPAITVAPIGLGAAMLVFRADSLSFEDYFGLQGCTDEEKAVRFLVGLTPSMLQAAYLADARFVDLRERRGPSTVVGCQLAAGLAGSTALKILLRRGKVLAAPWGLHFDAYRNRLVRTFRPFGFRNPLQRLLAAACRRRYWEGKPMSAAWALTTSK